MRSVLAFAIAVALLAVPARGQTPPGASSSTTSDRSSGISSSVSSEEAFTREAARSQEKAAWAMMPEILARIEAPTFPNRACRITDYGAVPDDEADDRPAITEALADCATQGGGRVVIPAGTFHSDGPIHFEDNINLHLAEGAVLRFGTNPLDYTPLVRTRWEGVFCYNYSPLIYAQGKTNLAITGAGLIDGQTEGTWSQWKRGNDGKNQEAAKQRLRAMGAERIPVEERIFGHGIADLDGDGMNDGDGQPHYLRPSLIQFLESTNILVEGVTLKSSPFWTVHFVLSENITARGLTIRPGTTNDDGIDPESSRYVLIENNDIHTYDDAIALKAGRDADGRAHPGTAYVVIRNNRLRSTVGGAMSIGSEMSGGVEQVFIERVVAENENGHGLYLKSNLDRGGFIRHLYVRDLDVLTAEDGFLVTSDYKGYRGGDHPPDVHDVFLQNVRIWSADQASIRLLGQNAAPICRLYLTDVRIRDAEEMPVLRDVDDLVVDDVYVRNQPWQP